MFRRKRLFPRSSKFWSRVNVYRYERKMVKAIKPMAMDVIRRLTKNELLADNSLVLMRLLALEVTCFILPEVIPIAIRKVLKDTR